MDLGGGMAMPIPDPVPMPMPDIAPPPVDIPLQAAVPPVSPPGQDQALAAMLQRVMEHQSALPPPPQRGIPVNQGRGTPDNPLAFLDKDPRVTQRFDGERGGFGRPPGDVILHDRAGSTPKDGPRYGVPGTGDTYPYHVEVQPDGSIKQFHQGTSVAPHAAGMSPYSLGVAYGGPYGATPTPQAMRSLQDVYSGLKQSNPDLQFRSHGQAFADTANNEFRASRSGRDMAEASWRNSLNDVPLQAAPNGPFEQFAYASPEKAFGSPGSQSVTGVSSRSVGAPPTQFAQAPAAAPPPLAARGIMTAAGYGNMAPQTPPVPTIPTPPPVTMAQAAPIIPERPPVTPPDVASRVAQFAPPLPLEFQNPGATRFAQPNLPGSAPPTAVADVGRFAQPGIAGAGYPMVADRGMHNAPPTMAANAGREVVNPAAPTLAQALQQQNKIDGGAVPSQPMPDTSPRRLADAGDALRGQTVADPWKPNWAQAGAMMRSMAGKVGSRPIPQVPDAVPSLPRPRVAQAQPGGGRMKRFRSAFPIEPTQT